jgi:predicted transcriptional regulator
MPVRTMTFRIPDDLYEAMEIRAREEDRSAGAVLRLALKAYLAQPTVGNDADR